MKKGFTMVELMVVVAMLMLLIGAVSSSVSAANKRAKISAATTVVQEMTNAILAYENSGNENVDLSKHVMAQWTVANESNLGFILGTESSDIPVYFNAALKGGEILDPWGNPYYVMIRKGQVKTEQENNDQVQTTMFYPNFNRVTAE